MVRVGVGKVELAMPIDKPKIPEASQIEPATGHALRKFLLEQEYIDDMAKVVWLQRFPGLSLVGEMDAVRALARAMICQLAAFHSPADVQIIVVSAAPTVWEWAKWLPHGSTAACATAAASAGCCFLARRGWRTSSTRPKTGRPAWSPPPSALHGGDPGRCCRCG